MPLSKIKKIRLSQYDKLWSKKAREDQPSCMYCGNTETLQAHHFIGRTNKATRLLLNNAVVLCAKHHTFNNDFSAHKTPEKFKRWFRKCYPDTYDFIKGQEKLHMTERQAIEQFKKMYVR